MPSVDTQKFEQKNKCGSSISLKKYTDDDDTSKKLFIKLKKHGADEPKEKEVIDIKAKLFSNEYDDCQMLCGIANVNVNGDCLTTAYSGDKLKTKSDTSTMVVVTKMRTIWAQTICA